VIVSPSRSTIRFVCSNCISPLEVKRRHAGAKVRCPWCHTTLVVPQESRPDAKAEVYELAGEAAASGPPPQPTVSFLCSLCGTRMDAPADRAGQKVACPDCGTSVVVPSPSQPSPSPTAAPGAAAGPADIYNVLEGQDQPPPTAAEVYRRHIPVVCTLCHTRMHATEDQVGQILVCPDCGTANLVPAYQAMDSPAPLAAVEGYQLAAAGDQPAPMPPKDRQDFTFTCPRCQTRLQAAHNQAGQRMTCPDCGTTFPVPQPSAEAPRWDPFEEAVGIYAIAGGQAAPAAAGPSPAPPAEHREPKSLAEVRPHLADRDLLPPRRLEHKLPPWPLVNGVFTFPFYRESCLASVKFTVGTVVAWGIAVLLWPIMMAMAAVMLFMWLVYVAWASTYLLGILTHTANGADRIEDWPSGDFIESAFQCVYIVSSLMMSVVIGLCAGHLPTGLPPGVGSAAATFFLFPILLLSMLETGTALNPISPAVWRSVFQQWWVWCGFFALAAFLVTASIGLEMGLRALGGPWATIPSVILTALAMMIYFRLLGRLGWYITAKARRGKKRSEV
jgi:DNA-directed RNA polymerase subunit RPC12/RpoP